MKKLTALLLVFSLCISLYGCNTIPEDDIVITLPAMFVGEDTSDTLTDEDKENGFTSVTKNEDGSLSYTISPKQHKKFLETVRKETSANLEVLIKDATPGSVSDISYNDDFSKIDITLDEAQFNSSSEDYFVIFGVGMTACMYQLITGTSYDDILVTIDLIDTTSGEVFNTVSYPTAFGG